MRAAEVFEHSDDVLDMAEIERVHDMRVATRRLRAALEVFEPCFPAKRHRKALKRVKALADALGPWPTGRRWRRWWSACASSSDRRTKSSPRASPPSG